MPLRPTDIVDDVLRVLTRAGGRSGGPHFLTAHQVLNRLPGRIRNRLIRERGRAGAGSGHYYASASVVAGAAKILRSRSRVDMQWLDTRGLRLQCDGESVQAGHRSGALYRVYTAESKV